MFPTLPENFGTLNLTELKALRDELKAAMTEALSNLTPEIEAALGQATEDLATVRNRIKALSAAEIALAEEDPEDEDDDEVDDEVEVVEVDEVEVDETTDDEEAEDETALVTATSANVTGLTVTSTGPVFKPTGKVTAKRQPKDKLVAPAALRAMQGSGKAADEPIESWTELASMLQERAGGVSPGSRERLGVARVTGNYSETPGRVLDDRVAFNLARFEPDELTAALCAPFTPYYNLGCMNTARRPVFNSLPQFQAPRGGVSIYPSPTLADITDGTGVWTHLDDANPTARKADCQEIECATPTDYVMYAVYRCLTVKNMLQMTFPELVEAYLNRLAAAWARMAERRLLDLMATAVTNVTAPAMAVGAAETLQSTLLRFITAYQERQRWDFDSVEVWAPRWLMTALKADLLHQRRTDGGKAGVVSDAAINAMFSSVGASVHWYLDDPTWASTVAPSQPTTDGNLVTWPNDVNLLVAPPGKFALIDRGELRIGVTGNNIYRDIESLMRNEFTFFFESFEGVVDTNSCPADLVEIPLCFNGVQVADVAVDCDVAEAA